MFFKLLPSIKESQVYSHLYRYLHLPTRSYAYIPYMAVCFQSQLYIDFPDTQCLGYLLRCPPNYFQMQVCIQGGPLPAITLVIIPISKVISPQLSISFRLFIGGSI